MLYWANVLTGDARQYDFIPEKKKYEIVATDIFCVLQVITLVSLFSDIFPTIK